MRFFAGLLAGLFLLWPLSGGAEANAAPVTVAVMPFVKLSGDKTVWLDKAIADIVTQKLAESNRYAVLNHDALETFLKEMQLEDSGFAAPPETMQRVGRIAKVTQMIYGTYALEGDHITVHLVAMDVASQKPIAQKDVSGDLNTLIPLCAQLVQSFLAGNNVALSPQEQANITFKPTDSLPAIEHFYRGLQAYDQGEYETAMGEFYAANLQDPNYLDAGLWFARMLEQLGRDDEAILAYLKLSQKTPESIEAIDARYFAARLQARTNPQEALKTYQTLTDIHPELPETMEAAYQAAIIARAQNMTQKSYTLYKQVDDFSDKVRKHNAAFTQAWEAEQLEKLRKEESWWQHLTGGGTMPKQVMPMPPDLSFIADTARHSRFFDWNHALSLYREAITAMVELYPDLLADQSNSNGPVFPPPRGSYLVDPANPVISGDVKERDKSLFAGDHTYYPHWKESFFALIIPKGYEAVGTELVLTGSLPDPSPTRDFTLRVMPFPLQQNYHNSWLGVIFGQTQTTSTLKKETPFFGNNQHLLALQLLENYGIVDHWQVTVRLRKEGAAEAKLSESTDPHSEGALLAKVRLGDDHVVETMPQFIMEVQPRQKMALAADKAGALWLAAVKGELYAQGTDLWMTHSTDGGKSWTQAEPMTVNSASQEFAPALMRAEDGSLQLFFLSDRRGLGWEIWTSRQDPQNAQWSHPARVPLRETAPGFEKDDDTATGLLPYAVMQDGKGQWLVAAYSRASHQLAFLTSEDLTHWSLVSTKDIGAVGTMGLGQDSGGRYYLAAISPTNDIAIYWSNDAKEWESAGTRSKKYDDVRAISTYPVTLFKRPGEGMEMLFSDVYTGLQYATLSPTGGIRPDLVTGSDLEPYAAAATPDGVTAALWKDDAIHIERYHHFALPDNGMNPEDSIIYTERSRDHDGGHWERIFARDRFRVPDVTAVGTSAGGRAWWGMETGAMSLKGSDFFFSDVSLGFFSHDVDRILSCDETTWFTSRDMSRPEVGYSRGERPNAFTAGRAFVFSEISGLVSAMACGAEGETYFGTGKGEVLVWPSEGSRRHYSLSGGDKDADIRALAFDPHTKQLLIGTHAGTLTAMNEKNAFSTLAHLKQPILALAADTQGRSWVAAEGEGILVLDGQGKTIRHFSAPDVPANIRKLVADKKGGVWAIADSDSLSPGLLHVTMSGVRALNPPQETLRAIIDFAVADDDSIWIGTNLRGIYHYREAQ